MRKFILLLLLISNVCIAKDTNFFRQHIFVFFYASTCSHCQQFAPILQSYANTHHVQVLPLSFDNAALPEFTQFQSVTTEWINTAFQNQAITYPALFIANSATQLLYPVAFGAMSETELNARIAILIPKIKAYEQRNIAS